MSDPYSNMEETLGYFLKAHKRGRKHLRSMKAATAIAYGLAFGTDLDWQHNQAGWRLKIGERETDLLLKLCEKKGITIDEITKEKV